MVQYQPIVQQNKEHTQLDIIELASAMLDITPRLLNRLNADVPLTDEQARSEHEQVKNVAQEEHDSHDAKLAEGLRVVSELRATPGQISLLRVLVEHERCMMQEIAEYLAVTPSTATAMVKRLVASGYIERSRDDSDWRTVWIRATEQGRQAVTVYDTMRLASLKKRLEQLSETERVSILNALPALQHLIEVYS